MQYFGYMVKKCTVAQLDVIMLGEEAVSFKFPYGDTITRF